MADFRQLQFCLKISFQLYMDNVVDTCELKQRMKVSVFFCDDLLYYVSFSLAEITAFIVFCLQPSVILELKMLEPLHSFFSSIPTKAVAGIIYIFLGHQSH